MLSLETAYERILRILRPVLPQTPTHKDKQQARKAMFLFNLWKGDIEKSGKK